MKNLVKVLCLSLLFAITFNVSLYAQWRELGGTLSIRLSCTCGAGASEMLDMVMDDSGNVYSCGYFTNSAGQYYVLKYDARTKVWSELGDPATGGTPLNANGFIYQLAIDRNGNVYARGRFTDAAGVNYVAKWDKASNAWINIGPYGETPAIICDAENNVYVSTADYSTGEEWIMKWNGSTWSQYGPAFDPSTLGSIKKMVIDDLKNIYAICGGSIIINNGTSWSSPISFVSMRSGAQCMALDPDRNLYIGGDFDDGFSPLLKVYKLPAKSNKLELLCSKTPPYTRTGRAIVHSITALSSSEIFVGGMMIVGDYPQLSVVKWSKATDEWSVVATPGDNISGWVKKILIDTFHKSCNILALGNLYNNDVGGFNTDDFIAEYTRPCNAFFSLKDSVLPHYYVLKNYSFGKGPLKYKWNWGDGSALDTGTTPSHTYATAGTYQICVEISDSVSCTSTYCTPSNSYLARTTADMVYVNVVEGEIVSEDTSPTALIEDNSENTVILYPNPSRGAITITSNSFGVNSIATIKDLTGRVVYNTSLQFLNNSCSLDWTGSSGVYVIEIREGTQKIWRSKLSIM